LLGFDSSTDEAPRKRWQYETEGGQSAVEESNEPNAAQPSVVAATPFDGGVVVGERSARGAIRCHNRDGTVRWRYDTRADVGAPQNETRFLLPFVSALATDGDRLYAAARRYERHNDGAER